MKTETQLQDIELKKLEPSTTNPRTNFAKQELEDLAQSLKTHGQLQPVVVRKKPHKGAGRPSGKFEIVAGERRFRAAVLAGLKTLVAVIRELSDQEVLEIQIIENLQREDIHPMDEATAFGKLLKHRTANSIAKAIGKTESYVSKRIKLTSLTKEMKKRFTAGEIKYIHAIQFARLSEDNQTTMWNELKRYEWNHFDGKLLVTGEDKLRKEIDSKLFHKISAGKFDPKDANLVTKFGACADCPMNTACTPQLFEDVKGDQCTNPRCYSNKERQTLKNKIIKLEKKFPDAVKGSYTWGGVVFGGNTYGEHKTGAKAPGKKWIGVIIHKSNSYMVDYSGKLLWINPEDSKARSNNQNNYANQQAKDEKARKIRHEFEGMILAEMLQLDLDQEPIQRIKQDYIAQGITNIGTVAELALLQYFDLIPKKTKFNTLEAYETAGYSDRQKFMKLLQPKLMEKSGNWLINAIEIAESTGGYSTVPNEDKTIRLVAIERGIDWDGRVKKYKRTRSLELTKKAAKK